jgi:hypothetical protein
MVEHQGYHFKDSDNSAAQSGTCLPDSQARRLREQSLFPDLGLRHLPGQGLEALASRGQPHALLYH